MGSKAVQTHGMEDEMEIFLNAGGALFLVFIVYHIYVSSLHIYFDQSKVRNDFLRSIVSVVEMHGDGLRVEKPVHEAFEVSPFLTQKANLKIYRQVGSWEVITGEIEAELSISGKLSYTFTNTGAYMNGNSPGPFYLPYSLISDKPVEEDANDSMNLNRLAKIDDGHVAELSLSVKNLISPEQLMKLLANYDVGVTAMSIYAGELKELDISYSRSGMYDYMTPHLTLKPLTLFGETGSSWYAYFAPDEAEQMQEQVQAMMSDLEWMTSNVQYNGSDVDQQRLAYLKKNGVQVYGAVVTGPVRELEKITKLPEFHQFQLNRVEIWNWN
ncbi:hypothetical protein ASD24_09640 [Paenibacillus sp. Root52]|uniref:anti sigma factor C-terminal domain-containing protein n=1 Tax=Paenibacillus sp. Root52 TaxID=1736552 RepID=UPI0006F283E8|nr:anti sigma factor C-terminal domain-containing protein [Paenibacillus sp. Root52]KQY84047.1 hypothetical protein ASD24_09640 [Paenibacillus sp. Root52]